MAHRNVRCLSTAATAFEQTECEGVPTVLAVELVLYIGRQQLEVVEVLECAVGTIEGKSRIHDLLA